VDREGALPALVQMRADHTGRADGEAIDRRLRETLAESLY